MDIVREEGGTLPLFAWPGGYPLVYVTKDGGELCSDCANGGNGSEADEHSDDPQWRLVGVDVHWEGQPIQCDHCYKQIESAYGPTDDDEDNPKDKSGLDLEWQDDGGEG